MIDYGLLVSVVLGLGLASGASWRWGVGVGTDTTTDSFLDIALGPALFGLAVGRLAALALDDPSSIGSVSDMLIIRSGVEFWPGVVGAASMVAWGARRNGVPPLLLLTSLLPLAIVGYAGYEAGCVFRDGCFGPSTTVGLRPDGVTTTMFPVGLMMAVALGVSAVAVRGLATRNHAPGLVVAAGTFAVAGIRAVGSVWLPHVGTGISRQHLSSIVVAVIAGAAVGAATLRSARAANAHLKGAPASADGD